MFRPVTLRATAAARKRGEQPDFLLAGHPTEEAARMLGRPATEA